MTAGGGPTRPGRPGRITLLDSMILIAAFAAGLPASRSLAGQEIGVTGPHRFNGYDPMPGGLDLQYYAWLVSPCLATTTIAVAALALRRRGRAFRWPGRSPGLAASAAAVVMLAVGAVSGFDRLDEDQGPLAIIEGCLIPFAPRNVGGVVAGVWLTLALSGRWRPRRDALDALGILLGACWIAAALLTYVAWTGLFGKGGWF